MRNTALPKITEKVFQEQVRKAAIVTGWKVYHTWNSFRSTEGFPDLVLVHPKRARLIFAELKSEIGKVSDAQQQWLDDLSVLLPFGVEVYMIRPSDFDWFWEVLKQ